MRKLPLKLLTPEEVAFQIGFLSFIKDNYYAKYDNKKLKQCWMDGFNARGALALINTSTNTPKAELEKIHELTKTN